jgi:hypothetical protein
MPVSTIENNVAAGKAARECLAFLVDFAAALDNDEQRARYWQNILEAILERLPPQAVSAPPDDGIMPMTLDEASAFACYQLKFPPFEGMTVRNASLEALAEYAEKPDSFRRRMLAYLRNPTIAAALKREQERNR